MYPMFTITSKVTGDDAGIFIASFPVVFRLRSSLGKNLRLRRRLEFSWMCVPFQNENQRKTISVQNRKLDSQYNFLHYPFFNNYVISVLNQKLCGSKLY